MSLGLLELDDAVQNGRIETIAGMLDRLELEVLFTSRDAVGLLCWYDCTR